MSSKVEHLKASSKNLLKYRNDPKFLDIQVRANSVIPEQTAPSSLIRV